jgi:Rod binding domain-containing protein
MRIGSELSQVGSLSAVTKPSDTEKLHKSAHEFEGMLFSSMWKEAQEGLDDDQGEDGLSVKMDGPLQAIGFQSLMGKATESGGLGIANMIEHSLAKSKAAGGHGFSEVLDSTVPADPAGTLDLRYSGQPENP